MSYEALATDPVLAAVPSTRSQDRDGSVDKTETYRPLSGKVKLGRRLEWKLCANIYTSLTGPSRICLAHIFRSHVPPLHAPPPPRHPSFGLFGTGAGGRNLRILAPTFAGRR